MLLLQQMRQLLEPTEKKDEAWAGEWLRSRVVRKMMDMSPGTLQNLRVRGKVRYKKVMGSYYYNRADLQKLFKEGAT